MTRLIIYKCRSYKFSRNLMRLKCKDRISNYNNNNNLTQIYKEGINEIISLK